MKHPKLDHSRAPVLEALLAFRDEGYPPFNPPGHRQGRGVDERVLEIVGEPVFASDVIAVNGLDDRASRRACWRGHRS